MLTKVNLPHA